MSFDFNKISFSFTNAEIQQIITTSFSDGFYIHYTLLLYVFNKKNTYLFLSETTYTTQLWAIILPVYDMILKPYDSWRCAILISYTKNIIAHLMFMALFSRMVTRITLTSETKLLNESSKPLISKGYLTCMSWKVTYFPRQNRQYSWTLNFKA